MMNEDIIKAIDGSYTAFENLMNNNYLLIHRFVVSKINGYYDQEDVKQEILMIVFLKIHTLKNPDSFKPWLISIMKNCCIKWYI